MVQNVAQLYNMLRSQAFDLLEANPRMLPRQFTPLQLNVEAALPSPQRQDAPIEKEIKPRAKKADSKKISARGR